MFNLRSTEARERYHVVFIRLMGNFERQYIPQWYKLLNVVYEDAAKLVGGYTFDLTVAIQKHQIAIQRVIDVQLRQVTQFFGAFTFDQFHSQFKSMGEVFDQEIGNWARLHAAKRIVDISRSTRKILNRTIELGLRDGLTTVQIANNIRDTSPTINKVRAIRIAQTETHTASNTAINTAVKSTGFNHMRIWLTAKDERVRSSHSKANNQRRNLETPFDVGGQKLDYPGDPNGSASNIVNCRCVLTYHTRKN